MKKRILSLVLAVVLVFGLLPPTAVFAEGEGAQTSGTPAMAVNHYVTLHAEKTQLKTKEPVQTIDNVLKLDFQYSSGVDLPRSQIIAIQYDADALTMIDYYDGSEVTGTFGGEEANNKVFSNCTYSTGREDQKATVKAQVIQKQSKEKNCGYFQLATYEDGAAKPMGTKDKPVTLGTIYFKINSNVESNDIAFYDYKNDPTDMKEQIPSGISLTAVSTDPSAPTQTFCYQVSDSNAGAPYKDKIKLADGHAIIKYDFAPDDPTIDLKPDTPTAKKTEKQGKTVTVTSKLTPEDPNESLEYGYSTTNDGKNIQWQSSPEFTFTGTDSYYFYARVAEKKGSHQAGPASDSSNQIHIYDPLSITYKVTKITLKQNEEITEIVPEIKGGYGTYSCTVSNDFPKGLNFNTQTGTISGKPSEYTDSELKVKVAAKDQDSNTVETELSFKFAVNPIPAEVKNAFSGYKQPYNGKENNVVVRDDEKSAGYTVEYGENEAGDFSSQPIKIKDVGNKTVYVKISRKGYTSVVIPITGEVTKREISITGAEPTGRGYESNNKIVGVTKVTFKDVAEELKISSDYTAEGEMKDANAGSKKPVTVTVTLKDKAAQNYKLSKNTFDTTVAIAQVDHAAITDIPEVEVSTNANLTTPKDKEVDLTVSLGNIDGVEIQKAEVYNDKDDLIKEDKITVNGLKLTFTPGKISKKDLKAEIRVMVTSTNYNKFEFNIIVKSVPKVKHQITSKNFANCDTATYGDSLATKTAQCKTGKVVYSSSAPEVVSVGQNGAVKILKASETPVTITAKVEETEEYAENSLFYEITKIEKKQLTIKNLHTKNRTYIADNVNVVLEGGKLDGLVNGDPDLSKTYIATAGTIADAKAGNGKKVTPVKNGFPEEYKDKYQEPVYPELTVDIAKVQHAAGTVSYNGPDIYPSTSRDDIAAHLKKTGVIVGSFAIEGTGELIGGRNNTLTWVFTPADENYEIDRGTIKVPVKADTLNELTLSGELAGKEWKFNDKFNISGLKVMAHYASGREVEVTNEVQYSTELAVGQEDVVLTYGGKTVTVHLEKPVEQADAPVLKPIDIKVKVGNVSECVVTIPAFAELKNGGKITYTAGKFTDNDQIIDEESGFDAEKGQYSFKLKSTATEGQKASIVINVISENYKPTSVTINIEAAARSTQQALRFTNASSVAVNKTLNLTVSGGSGSGDVVFSVINGEKKATIEGSKLIPSNMGQVTVKAVKEGDENYFPTSVTMVVNITKKEISGGGSIGGGAVEPEEKPEVDDQNNIVADFADKETAQMDKNTIDQILSQTEENKNAGLKVEIKEGTVVYDSEALDVIAKEAEDADSISVSVKKTESKQENMTDKQEEALNEIQKNPANAMFSVTLEISKKNGTKKEIHDFGGGNATITVSYRIPSGKTVQVFRLEADGSKTPVKSFYDAVKGLLSWITPSHSYYVVTTTDETEGWNQDENGWFFMENGRKLTNKWRKDSTGWCYIGADGYMVTEKWAKDSHGWCYLNKNGHQAFKTWAKDSVDWCYVGADGYMVTNRWAKDSVTWCYVGADGRMVRNRWMKDSIDWCYLGAGGRMIANAWQGDSKGMCYVGKDGRIVRDSYVTGPDGDHYVDKDGYKVL